MFLYQNELGKYEQFSVMDLYAYIVSLRTVKAINKHLELLDSEDESLSITIREALDDCLDTILKFEERYSTELCTEVRNTL